MTALLDALAGKSGLSPIFAKRVIGRAVLRAGIDPESLQRKDLERLVPELRRALGVYLGEADARDKVHELVRTLQAGDDG